MPKFFSRTTKTDPARARYPEAMADLLSLGETAHDFSYADWADRLRDHVADLVRMVLDDDLNNRKSKDPAVWAPIHALGILKLLGPAEAAEPLLACMDWGSDWFEEELPPVYGAIGPAAIPLLKAYLEDPAHDQWGRGRASSSLKAIAQAHPAERDDLVALLTAFLDRPGADSSAEEESLTASVIGDLADLEATTSYDAIRRAFEQNRVDTQFVGLEEVERSFGMRPPLDFSKPPEPRQEPGVRLALKCKVCGREREHVFPKVYCDLGTINDKKKREKYNPIIIPQRVVCPKCGAVDQYELGGMGYVALIASTLAASKPELAGMLRQDQQVQFITSTTRWGNMHPLEAIERYQQEIGRRPDDVSLRIGLGSVYKAIGRYDEAEVEFERAMALDPLEPEVWINKAQLAGLRRDIPQAIRLWQRAGELLPRSALSEAEREEVRQDIEETLADLRRGVIPEVSPPMWKDGEEPPPTFISGRRTASRAAPQPDRLEEARPIHQPTGPTGFMTPAPQPKVGRNEPCPCGSGKKYKHCHGRKGQAPL